MKYNEYTDFKEAVIAADQNTCPDDKEEYLALKQDENVEIYNKIPEIPKLSIKNFFKSHFYHFIYYLPFILATITYIFTLQGCHLTLLQCVEKYPPSTIKLLGITLILCGTLYVIQILLYVYKYTNYKPVLIQTIIIIFLCFIYDTGNEMKSHGAYNSTAMFIGIILTILIFLIGLFIKYWIKKYPIITIFVMILIIGFSSYKINYVLAKSCDYWIYGFKGTKLEYSDDIGCNIHPPNICYYTLTKGWFDFTRLTNYECKGDNSNFSALEPYIQDKNSKIIGYPRTETFKIFPDSIFLQINKNVVKKIINMEDPKIDQSIKDKIEITTNFYKNPPEVNIDLKYNSDIVKERREIRKDNKNNPITKNVLTFFIDSLSRNNFRLRLPKFYAWIENFYLNNANKDTYSKQKLESFEFKKYHGLGRYTAFNMVPTTFGVFNIYYSGKMYLKEYKQAGYIIGQSNNFCVREIFDIELGGTIEEYYWETFDHEFISLFCDPNFSPIDQPNKGTNSFKRRCIYGNDTITYAFEYLWQFFTKYKDEPKYFRLGSADAHEGSTEVITHYDDIYTDFFTKFQKAGFLDDTALIIHSDHGFAMPGPYSLAQTEDWNWESVLPSLFMILPTNAYKYDEIRDNLKHNEQSLITPFNLYNSYKALLGLPKYKKSLTDKHDFITEMLPKSRDCSVFYDNDYYDTPGSQLCRCSNKKHK